MVRITDVEKNSYADKVGIAVGDILVSISSNPIADVLDYRFYLTEKEIALTCLRGDEEYTVNIKKGQYDDIGLDFATPLMDEKKTCKNKCIFFFIDQNPKGLRDSLYFKDDDSRLSFIHGNYITLTNLTESDADRIVKMRFSPMNISIHTTNPELRVKMMKNKHSGEVLSYLKKFSDAGISMCGQIVLCRGYNDGEELIRTMNDLTEYFPALGSVSIVPAGLTKFRDGLAPLSDFTREEAGAVIDAVNLMGQRMLAEHGARVFFAADELYLKAGRKIPDEEYYEDYPQIENGVGMIRSFVEEFALAKADVSDMRDALAKERVVSVATGVASYDMVSALCGELCSLFPKLRVNVYKIINRFFGESITVSGLLTGKDMYEQLSGAELGSELFIPENTLKDGEDVFLCGMTLDELSDKLSVKVRVSVNDGYEFLRDILGVD